MRRDEITTQASPSYTLREKNGGRKSLPGTPGRYVMFMSFVVDPLSPVTKRNRWTKKEGESKVKKLQRMLDAEADDRERMKLQAELDRVFRSLYRLRMKG
jgi:hypothetical protein